MNKTTLYEAKAELKDERDATRRIFVMKMNMKKNILLNTERKVLSERKDLTKMHKPSVLKA